MHTLITDFEVGTSGNPPVIMVVHDNPTTHVDDAYCVYLEARRHPTYWEGVLVIRSWEQPSGESMCAPFTADTVAGIVRAAAAAWVAIRDGDESELVNNW